MPAEILRVALVRLCECEGNKLGRISSHGPLTEEGRRQAAAVCHHLLDSGLRACASPANSACEETATIIAQGLPVIDADEFREPPYPKWAGMKYKEAEAASPEEWHRYWHPRPGDAQLAIAPDGESWQATFNRTTDGLRRLVRDCPGSGLLAIVTHGEVVRLLTIGLLGAPLENLWRLGGRNGAVTLFEYDGAVAKFEYVNGTAHLGTLSRDVGREAPSKR